MNAEADLSSHQKFLSRGLWSKVTSCCRKPQTASSPPPASASLSGHTSNKAESSKALRQSHPLPGQKTPLHSPAGSPASSNIYHSAQSVTPEASSSSHSPNPASSLHSPAASPAASSSHHSSGSGRPPHYGPLVHDLKPDWPLISPDRVHQWDGNMRYLKNLASVPDHIMFQPPLHSSSSSSPTAPQTPSSSGSASPASVKQNSSPTRSPPSQPAKGKGKAPIVASSPSKSNSSSHGSGAGPSGTKHLSPRGLFTGCCRNPSTASSAAASPVREPSQAGSSHHNYGSLPSGPGHDQHLVSPQWVPHWDGNLRFMKQLQARPAPHKSPSSLNSSSFPSSPSSVKSAGSSPKQGYPSKAVAGKGKAPIAASSPSRSSSNSQGSKAGPSGTKGIIPRGLTKNVTSYCGGGSKRSSNPFSPSTTTSSAASLPQRRDYGPLVTMINQIGH
ncbi:unnamed protein product [Sympodiomycopsis kandeliae]